MSMITHAERFAALPSRLGAVVIAASALQPTFRTSTRLIEVTVVVQDSDRKPVAGLTRDDFKLYDDGKEQPNALFSEQREGAAALHDGAASNAPLPGLFSNQVDTQRMGSVTVILLDRVNSRMEDQTRAREQVLKFLGQIRPEDQSRFDHLGEDRRELDRPARRRHGAEPSGRKAVQDLRRGDRPDAQQ